MSSRPKRGKITDLMDPEAVKLFQLKGDEAIAELGDKTVKTIVGSVLCGENIRGTTEAITRGRIALANAYMLQMMLKGNNLHSNFLDWYTEWAAEQLSIPRYNNKVERWVLNWLLGLTDKGTQNILRDEYKGLTEYRQTYEDTVSRVAEDCELQYGTLSGSLKVEGMKEMSLDWEAIIKILSIAGNQALTLRGSDKSRHGKIFEKLVLASMLHIQGFRYVNRDSNTSFDKVFWLSHQEEKRESDATAIYEEGSGIVFDIGFIGRGNPEITLDKVTRFDKQMIYGQRTHEMHTVILVDRIGENSRIADMATEVDGHVIQMSDEDWMRQVAQVMDEVLGKPSAMFDMDVEELHSHIEEEMQSVPIGSFLHTEGGAALS